MSTSPTPTATETSPSVSLEAVGQLSAVLRAIRLPSHFDKEDLSVAIIMYGLSTGQRFSTEQMDHLVGHVFGHSREVAHGSESLQDGSHPQGMLTPPSNTQLFNGGERLKQHLVILNKAHKEEASRKIKDDQGLADELDTVYIRPSSSESVVEERRKAGDKWQNAMQMMDFEVEEKLSMGSVASGFVDAAQSPRQAHRRFRNWLEETAKKMKEGNDEFGGL